MSADTVALLKVAVCVVVSALTIGYLIMLGEDWLRGGSMEQRLRRDIRRDNLRELHAVALEPRFPNASRAALNDAADE